MKTEITDYLYKNKEIPYWEDEVISLVNNIIKDHDQELLIEIEKIIDKKIQEDTVNGYTTEVAIKLTELKQELNKFK